MWVITRDFLYERGLCDKSEVGKTSPDFNKEKCTNKFRLYDDDKFPYYEGLSDSNDSERAFEPLDYYYNHSGCTYMEYEYSKGIWSVL